MAAVRERSPGEALMWVADQLSDTGDLFFTGVIVRVSASTGLIEYANAGHPPILLAGLTGVAELGPTGPLVGPWPAEWQTVEAKLDRGGVMVVYSDGLIEARDGDGDLFGTTRLTTLVAEQQLAGVDAVADAALAAVQAFAAEPGRDDITLGVVSR
jgi:sigma-B regulation protein RsbU (phosphoserine phosphatase)